jgi:predicted hotdog family 3-hydroxylacyl-ACP dehydratase
MSLSPVYETYSTLPFNGVEVIVRIRYTMEDDAVFLQQARVEGDPADWLLDVFEDALTEACELDYVHRAETWAEDAAEARHDARQEARGL